MKRFVLPALIINSQHAVAAVQGVPLADGSKVHKSVECRGSRCFTLYRGSVAVFASNSYSYDNEDHYAWYGSWLEQKNKDKPVKKTQEQDTRFRAWSQYTHAWRYRLVGFVRLTNVLRSADMEQGGKRMLEIHKYATDYRGQWMDPPPATYLNVEPLAETTAADGPKFSDACYGCNVADPRHNPAACHVNWQTVCMEEKHVPLHVQQEIGTWLK